MKKGDKGEPTEVSNNGSRPTPNEPESARQKALADKIMEDDREVLRKLAE